jgi:hypothetical protein
VSDETQTRRLRRLEKKAEALAEGLAVEDCSKEFGDLVGSRDLRHHPVHRWFYYKEAFSPALAPALVERLGVGESQRVVDCFAGVGTTPLSLVVIDQVVDVVGVEYSPFAAFAAGVKLSAYDLDAKRLAEHGARLAVSVAAHDGEVSPPELSSFSNTEMFDPIDLEVLLRVREVVMGDELLTTVERNFFLLGLASTIEDVSGAMKDGRALRLLRGRKRRRNTLHPHEDIVDGDAVLSVVRNQWAAMIEDVALLDPERRTGRARIVQSDARCLESVLASADDSQLKVGLHVFSPPYLNCLDYTEVYKLELWLLEFVKNQAEFRQLREGTLRSHPSIKFPDRQRQSWGRESIFEFIDELTGYLEDHLPRASVGTMVGEYFRDMYEVLLGLERTLELGGHLACVIANSTFAGRARSDGKISEAWRLTVMTDVLLARLAEQAGLEPVSILEARHLRPRNATDGSARESIVVCRKATGQEEQR